MPNKAAIFKLITRNLILDSVPGIRERIRQRRTILEKSVQIMPSMSGGFIPPELITMTAPQPVMVRYQRIADIDFGKVTPLIQNATITMIECPGPAKNLIYRTYNVRRAAQIILSQAELQDLIIQFSRKSQIPIQNGLFRAWVDRFLISAVVGNGLVTSFIIQKIIYPHFV
jgi:hypothetical protein